MSKEFDSANKQQAAKTPLEDLRQSALEHYREASSKLCHWNSFVENAIMAYNPESSHQPKEDKPERDWEILEFKSKERPNDIRKLWEVKDGHDGTYTGGCGLYIFLEGDDWLINKVRRNSDGEVFSVGDEVGHKHGFNNATIQSFYITDKNEMGCLVKWENGQANWFIENWKKLGFINHIVEAVNEREKSYQGLNKLKEQFPYFKSAIQNYDEFGAPEKITVKIERQKHRDPRIKPLELIISPSHGIAEWQLPELRQAIEDYLNPQQKSKPKEELKEPERTEITKVWRASGGISNLDGKPFHAYHFNSVTEIPKEKLPLIKQAIEQVLNDDGIIKDELYPSPLYTQKKVNKMMEDAFKSGRASGDNVIGRIEFTDGDWSNKYDWKYPSFQDYKQKLSQP